MYMYNKLLNVSYDPIYNPNGEVNLVNSAQQTPSVELKYIYLFQNWILHGATNLFRMV